jgi:catechol 2,3-dioxygenase-like lactoylglutathione lyase family enzyme
MNAHVSSILLGVSDMDRSKRFYTEGLGWKVQRAIAPKVRISPTRSKAKSDARPETVSGLR